MVEGVGEFWGLSANAWIAVGTVALAIATIALVVAALIQIRSLRAENRKAQTLAACGNYDLNPNVYESLQTLWAALESGELEREPRKFRPQRNTVLNFLDAIAIGIEQGLYIETLAWDHLEVIVRRHVKRYIDSGIVEKAGLEREDFVRLIDLRDRWVRVGPRFRDIPWWKFWRRGKRI
jgi:hypothetical protein